MSTLPIFEEKMPRIETDVRFTPNPNSAPNGPLIERSE